MAEVNFTRGKKNVVNAITEATAPTAAPGEMPQRVKREYTKEEKARYLSEMNTSGRKGVKLPRVNLAITPDNLAYIKTMARVTGDGMTGFVNWVLFQHMQEHMDLYDKAQAFQKALDED